MNTKKRIIKLIIITLSIILIFGIGFQILRTQLADNIFGHKTDKAIIINTLKNNKDYFTKVITYIENYNKSSKDCLYFEKTKNSYITEISTINMKKQTTFKKIIIDNIEVDKSVKYIFNKLHFKLISEYDGNYIYFTTNDGFGHGIAFTRNGEMQFGRGMPVDRIEKISDNWYYYEGD